MPPFVTDLTREVFRLWREFYWLPEWAVVTLIVAVFVLIGWAANQVVFGLLKFAVRKRDVFWRGVVGRARLKVRIAVMIVALALAVTVSPLDPEPSEWMRQALAFLFILTLGWMAIGASDMWAVVYLRRFNMASEDNLIARKHITQARILQRVAALLIGAVTLGLALLTIAEVRQWGMSLLASAGVVGIIAGFALQPLLTNLIAGVQIATDQPIRLDDAVIVEGEWGTIEEITSTYVVVKLWDGDVLSLQVTDVTDRVAQVRCLASARNGAMAFDLRCEIREKMLAFMRDQCPEALPRDRIDLNRLSPPDATPPARP
jgi:small-conductance mechanosensitive channel